MAREMDGNLRVRWRQRDFANDNLFVLSTSALSPVLNGDLDNVLVECCHDAFGAVANSAKRVNVAQHHDWSANFQFQDVIRDAVDALTVHLCILQGSCSTALQTQKSRCSCNARGTLR